MGRWSNPRWRKYSRFMRKWHPWCTNCKSGKNLQVHHTWYSPRYSWRKWWPIWFVPPWVLMVLCADCHSDVTALHNTPRYNVHTATVAVLGRRKYNIWKWSARAPFIAVAVLLLGILFGG